MIEMSHVSKRFLNGSRLTENGRESYAVKDVSFRLEKGEIAAFLGPNGAGKTTTKRLITGYLAPDQGEIRVMGMCPRRDGRVVRRRLGYLPEHNPLYDDLTVFETLRFAARVQGILGPGLKSAIRRMVDLCDLGPHLKRSVAVLSKGFRQRVGLAVAMIHDPDLLILDEPTTGLDPNQIHYIQQVIKNLGGHRTVLLSTHILHQVPDLCSRVLVLCEGSLVFDDRPQALLARGRTVARIGVAQEPDAVLGRLESLGHRATCLAQDPERSGANPFVPFTVEGNWTEETLADLAESLRVHGWRVGECVLTPPTIESIFAGLTAGDGTACASSG